MIFVADAVPSELRAIVEFLNKKMDVAGVLAIEVRQYVGGDLKTLVPQVVAGRAMEPPNGPWTEKRFFEALRSRGAEEERVAMKLYDWAQKKMTEIR
jgi:hypothetical protein